MESGAAPTDFLASAARAVFAQVFQLVYLQQPEDSAAAVAEVAAVVEVVVVDWLAAEVAVAPVVAVSGM